MIIRPAVGERLHRQRGQALVEAVVAMLLLLPLFLAVYLLWAWQDVRYAALVTARYAVFDAALGGSADAVARSREALRKHVLDGRRRGWQSLDSGGSSLIDDAQLRIELQPWPLPGSLLRTEDAAFALLVPALALGSGSLDLQRGGGIRSNVSLPVRAALIPGAGERLQGPRLTASLSLLADPWRAASPDAARARVAALSVAGRTREWVEPLRGVRDALTVIEPAFERLCLGRIDVDVVPVDRLAGPAGSTSALGEQPCP